MTRAAKKHPGSFENRGEYQRLILCCGGIRHTFRLDTFDKKASEKFAREKLRELQKQLDRTKIGLAGVTKFSALLAAFRRDDLPTLAAGTQRSYKDSLAPVETFFTTEMRDPSLDKIGCPGRHDGAEREAAQGELVRPSTPVLRAASR